MRPSICGASSPSTTVRRAGLEGEPRSEDREQTAVYLQGREVWTIVTYNTEYRRLVEFYRRRTGLWAMSLCFRLTYLRWRKSELDLTGQGQGAF